MMTRNPRLAAAVAIVTTAIAVTMVLHSVKAPAQTVQTSQVMRQKLAEAQQLLTALVTRDWTALDRHTRALESLTKQPGWDVMHMPEYHDQTVAFQRALAQLSAAVGQRDQRTAVTAYNALVSSCVECHRYVARARIATAK